MSEKQAEKAPQRLKITFEFPHSPDVFPVPAGKTTSYSLLVVRNGQPTPSQTLPPEQNTFEVVAIEGEQIAVLVAPVVNGIHGKSRQFLFKVTPHLLPRACGDIEMASVSVVGIPLAVV